MNLDAVKALTIRLATMTERAAGLAITDAVVEAAVQAAGLLVVPASLSG